MNPLLQTLVASVLVDERKGFAMERFREAQRTLWPSGPPLVSVVARYDGMTLALDLHGEADRYTAGRLLADMLTAVRPELERVRVDLTDLSFCDLGGSDALHAFVDRAGSRGISVELHGMSALFTLIYNTYPPCPVGLTWDFLDGSRPAEDPRSADAVAIE